MTEQAAKYEYAPNKFGARPLDCDCRKWTHFVEPGVAICVKCELDRAQGEVAALEVLLTEARAERDEARELAQATAQEAELLRDKLEHYTAPIDAAQESEWKRARKAAL